MKITFVHTVLFGLVLTAGITVAHAEEQLAAEHVRELSLEQLMNVKVVSVSKASTALIDAPAAIYVVSAEDMRRAGAFTIPDALRMVPGLHVAQIDASKWAVSSRGFAQRHSNKLLVLVDGRSIYSPLFSGVYWESEVLSIESIERIEVIRGPGASLWGANAVNGVINIITKSAEDTQGVALTGGTGNSEPGFADLRYGGRIGENAFYRLSGRWISRGSQSTSSGADAGDSWDIAQGLLRLDWQSSQQDQWMATAGLLGGDSMQKLSLPLDVQPYQNTYDGGYDLRSGHALVRWNHTFAQGSSLTLQAYYKSTLRGIIDMTEWRQTFDFELQQNLQAGSRNQFVFGGGARHSSDELTQSGVFTLAHPARRQWIANAFVQDRISLVPERLSLTLGTKLEQHEGLSAQLLPTARVLYSPSPSQALWGCWSRASRSPSRIDRDVGFLVASLIDPSGTPVVIRAETSGDFGYEHLSAWELGYRFMPAERLSVDVTGFYNYYDRLRGSETVSTSIVPIPFQILVTFPIVNNDWAETRGVELGVDWEPLRRMKLRASYSYLDVVASLVARTADGIIPDGDSYRHMLNLRMTMQLRSDLELSVNGYHYDKLRTTQVPAHTRLDVQAAWRLHHDVRLVMGGRDLLEDHHLEWAGSFYELPSEIRRSFFALIELRQ